MSTAAHTPVTWKRTYVTIACVVAGLLSIGIIMDQFVLPLIVSSTEVIQLPNVVGKDIGTVRPQLQGLGLQVMDVREQYSDKVVKGRIMSQNPYPGATVKEGRRIYLTVSKGIETVRVPNLSGVNLRDARLTLMRLGLNMGNISYEYSDSIALNRVLAQGIPSDAQLPYGGSIDVVVSQGPNGIHVPDVFGMSVDEARQALEQSGLQLGIIAESSSGAFDPRTVISQTPRADSVVPSGTPISITIVK